MTRCCGLWRSTLIPGKGKIVNVIFAKLQPCLSCAISQITCQYGLLMCKNCHWSTCHYLNYSEYPGTLVSTKARTICIGVKSIPWKCVSAVFEHRLYVCLCSLFWWKLYSITVGENIYHHWNSCDVSAPIHRWVTHVICPIWVHEWRPAIDQPPSPSARSLPLEACSCIINNCNICVQALALDYTSDRIWNPLVCTNDYAWVIHYSF